MKFIIPFRNQVGVIANRTHLFNVASTFSTVKTTVHEVLGLYAIPEEKRAGLVTHFYKDPAKRCFALETEDDWMALKDEWASQVAKRGAEAAVEIVLLPKVRVSYLFYCFELIYCIIIVFPIFRGSGQGSDRHREESEGEEEGGR
jgi:hypothetical protein